MVKPVLATLLRFASLRPLAAPVLCLLASSTPDMEHCGEAPKHESPSTGVITDQAGPAVLLSAQFDTTSEPFTSLEMPVPWEAFTSSGAAPPVHPRRA